LDVVSSTKDLLEWSIPFLDRVPVIRAILGIVLVFFAPGFTWSLVMFQRINHLERLVLSFGLSIAIVTLSVLLLNLVFHVRITGLNALINILCLIAVPLVIKFTAGYVRKRRSVPVIKSETDDVVPPKKENLES
jgi:uncharacterized membrane protein